MPGDGPRADVTDRSAVRTRERSVRPINAPTNCREISVRFDAEVNKTMEPASVNSQPRVFAYPARVSLRAAASAKTNDQLMALARGQARDPKIFDEKEPYFFPAQISSDALDAWYTRMAPSSLKNYAAEAAEGISFQDSHNSRRLPIGKSLTGTFAPAGEGGTVTADFYLISGLNFEDGTYSTSDDYINAIRAGIVEDVSIGFYGGEYICSVCGGDMLDWYGGCSHWPGDVIETKDKDGKVTGQETVFAWVANAHLAEVSAVYEGATPGAAILRAQDAAARGRLSLPQIRLLEQRYRVRLNGAGAASTDMSLEAHSQTVVNSVGELMKRYRGRREDRSQDNRGLSQPDAERLTALKSALQLGCDQADELLKVPRFISKEDSERLRRGETNFGS
jgi:hypothetical protein